MRRQISIETWEQIKTAYASGIRLWEIATVEPRPQRLLQQVACFADHVQSVANKAHSGSSEH